MNLFLSNVLVTCATKLCSTNSWAGRRFKPLTQITHFTVTGLLSVYYEINTNTNKWVTARSLLYVILPNTFWHCHHRPEVVWLHWHVYAWDWVSKNLLSVSTFPCIYDLPGRVAKSPKWMVHTDRGDELTLSQICWHIYRLNSSSVTIGSEL